MDEAPKFLIAGAGIGGLAAALTLARAGFRVAVLEAAAELREVGAGLQLSPNAARVLIGLGLEQAIAARAVAPAALRVRRGASGRVLALGPLGETARARYGAPFWVIHRADLQRVLWEAVRAEPAVDLHLGVRVEDFAAREGGIVIVARGRIASVQMQGAALIGADGLWSALRGRLGLRTEPVFCGETAWRALVPVEAAPAPAREAMVNLWLGPRAHVVHYPVCDGKAVNIVAIIRDAAASREWAVPGDPAVLAARFARWAPDVRALLSVPKRWEKWALHVLPVLPAWGVGPVALLGDAAHAMPPFLAQGACMAIEDAAALARHAAANPRDLAAALAAYAAERSPRAARVQAEALAVGRRYGWGGPFALARDLVLARMGAALVSSYDWIYDWRGPVPVDAKA